MKTSVSLVASAAAILLSGSAEAESLYSKKSAVLQVDAKSYGSLIAKSNHTSIVEFYAPWCGHCKSLKPAYEKAAKNLKGLAKVAAVNCDDDSNKAFCGDMGVKGFPTLKIIRPSKKAGRPMVEEYQGARSAKAIVDAVVEKIPNHVKRVTDKSIDAWLKESNETAKAILFTEKGTTSALLRALAIDFLGSVNVGQVRNKESDAVKTFGVSKYPTLVLLPGGDKEGIVYNGELNKEAMTEFLGQVASPNPDPAPSKNNAKAKTSSKKQKTTKIPEPVEEDATAEAKVQEESKAQPLIPPIHDEATLKKKCFLSTSKICALVLLPAFDPAKDQIPPNMIEGLRSMAEVYDKHAKRHSSFAFYLVEPSLPIVAELRKDLALKPANELDLIAVNAKRSWVRKFTASEFTANSVEAWVDAIRMNEGKKETLPEGFIVDEEVAVKEAVKEEKEAAKEAKKEEKDEL